MSWTEQVLEITMESLISVILDGLGLVRFLGSIIALWFF